MATAATTDYAALAGATFTGTTIFPLNGTTGLSGITIGTRKLFVATSTPTGMATGDIWIQV